MTKLFGELALALTVAIFIQLYYMGLLNSLTGVVLVMSALELPFAIFVLKSFFDKMDIDGDGKVTKEEAIKHWGKNFANVLLSFCNIITITIPINISVDINDVAYPHPTPPSSGNPKRPLTKIISAGIFNNIPQNATKKARSGD